MNHDGSSMTNDLAFDAWPRWSPDGKRIVFASNRENKTDYEIYLMNANGNSVQRLTELHGRNTSPKWSPDEKKISFDHAAQGECDIFTIDAPRKQGIHLAALSGRFVSHPLSCRPKWRHL